MRLSKKTLEVLKNFSMINTNLLIQEGNTLSTMAVAKNIVASVDVDEDFDEEVGIFNLQEFLGVVNLMGNPDITFTTDKMTLEQGKSKMQYAYADKSILIYPNKQIKMPTPLVEFDISADQLDTIKKAAATIGVQDLAIVGEDEALKIKVLDKKNNAGGNVYELELDGECKADFTAYFRIENLKQISDDYKVSLASVGTNSISQFVGKNMGITYYIALEQDSEF